MVVVVVVVVAAAVAAALFIVIIHSLKLKHIASLPAEGAVGAQI